MPLLHSGTSATSANLGGLRSPHLKIFGCIFDFRLIAAPTSPPNNPSKMSTAQKKTGKAQGRSAIDDVVAREYTIHLHKRVRSV